MLRILRNLHGKPRVTRNFATLIVRHSTALRLHPYSILLVMGLHPYCAQAIRKASLKFTV